MRKFILFIPIIFIIINCEGPSGPEGKQGPQGPEGPAGTANVITETFSISANNTNRNDDGNIGWNEISMSDITSDVYNNGLVKVEIGEFFVGGYSGLPLTVDAGSVSLTRGL